jgi:hypothetical protein
VLTTCLKRLCKRRLQQCKSGAWPSTFSRSSLPREFSLVDVTVEANAPVFAKVIEEAIVQFFKGNGYEIFKQKYSSIWEVGLRKAVAASFGALQLQPTLAFSVHMFYSKHIQSQVLHFPFRRSTSIASQYQKNS